MSVLRKIVELRPAPSKKAPTKILAKLECGHVIYRSRKGLQKKLRAHCLKCKRDLFGLKPSDRVPA